MQHLSPRAVGRRGPAGMQHDPPAPSVDAHVVVELAQKDATVDGGLTAVLLVDDVMHVAPGGGTAAVRPGAVPVAEPDRPADGR